MTNPRHQALPARDLSTGDFLLRLGGVGYAQLRNPDGPPVIVAEVRPPLDTETDDVDSTAGIIEILTSAGTIYARGDAPALVLRSDTVTNRTVLLISRRQSLHSRLVELGTAVIRRTPVTDDKTTHRVTAAEWSRAPLIVIDAYLAVSTLRSMWQRGDLSDRDQIVMVGSDPDDVRAEARQSTARARMFTLLPYDKQVLSSLFDAATNTERSHDPFLGILTPVAAR